MKAIQMRSLLSAALCLVLASCQTIRVQGVEITPETQFHTAVALMMVGTAIHVFAHENDRSEGSTKRTCIKFVNVPTGKNAPLQCEVYADEVL